jgi:hypothetical protein
MWTWKISTGTLSRDGRPIASGYSGRGEGKNNPAWQKVKGQGPIPVGMYSIGAPHDSAEVGPYALALTPMAGNEMYGRGDFLAHGDSTTHPGWASKGCIILARIIRRLIWNSGDRVLKVVA